MLTEPELREEIQLIQDKIKKYRDELQPYLQIIDSFQREVDSRFVKTLVAASELKVTITMSAVTQKLNQIKIWENELRVYNRILEGKRMDKI